MPRKEEVGSMDYPVVVTAIRKHMDTSESTHSAWTLRAHWLGTEVGRCLCSCTGSVQSCSNEEVCRHVVP